MPSHSLATPVQGAFIELQQLIEARFIAQGININKQQRALSQLIGQHKSLLKGRGLDFAEVRHYQAGDDIRSIDWRVTARSSKPHTKIFNEERERPVLIINDQRQAMFFGSQHCFKATLACYLSALFGWAAIQQGDRVGGLVFNDSNHKDCRPKASRKALLSFFQQCTDFNHQLDSHTVVEKPTSESLKETLIELRRVAKPGSHIILISDFSGFQDPGIEEQLHILARHCQLTALFIFDNLEKTLPSSGYYNITNGVNKTSFFSGDKQLQKHYQDQFHEKLNALQQLFLRLKTPLIPIATHQAPLDVLLTYYHRSQ